LRNRKAFTVVEFLVASETGTPGRGRPPTVTLPESMGRWRGFSNSSNGYASDSYVRPWGGTTDANGGNIWPSNAIYIMNDNNDSWAMTMYTGYSGSTLIMGCGSTSFAHQPQ